MGESCFNDAVEEGHFDTVRYGIENSPFCAFRHGVEVGALALVGSMLFDLLLELGTLMGFC